MNLKKGITCLLTLVMIVSISVSGAVPLSYAERVSSGSGSPQKAAADDVESTDDDSVPGSAKSGSADPENGTGEDAGNASSGNGASDNGSGTGILGGAENSSNGDGQQGSSAVLVDEGTAQEGFVQTAKAGSVAIRAKAPAGAFSSAVTLHAEVLSGEKENAALETLGGAIRKPDRDRAVSQYYEKSAAGTQTVYDIWFEDKDGNRVEPERTVEITFRAPSLRDPGNTAVYHVENGKAVPVKTTAGAHSVRIETDRFSPFILQSPPANGQKWGWDAYYIGESSPSDTTKKDDFKLKYQVEFHSSVKLKQGAIRIRIPASLLKHRNGDSELPYDISVPKITKQEAENGEYKTRSSSTPFNYYIDDDGSLVFVNYKALTPGANTSFQVMYKTIDVLTVKDGTVWSLQPEISVDVSADDEAEKRETQAVEPLTGRIDTSVHLTGLNKVPFHQQGSNYTPGLYTERQVRKAVQSWAPGVSADDIDVKNYRYVVWKVTAVWRGNQPASITGKDIPSIDGSGGSGKVIGYSRATARGDGFTVRGDRDSTDTYKAVFNVVTAYPADQVTAGETLLKNDVQFTMTPSDGIDPAETKTAGADWTYQNYSWTYSGDIIGVEKWNTDHDSDRDLKTKHYQGTATVLKGKLDQDQDYGDLPYTTEGSCKGYGITHKLLENQTNYTVGSIPYAAPIDYDSVKVGDYVPGTSYKMTVVDDAVYLFSDHEAASASNLLTDDDYYFSSVSVTRQDNDYDMYEDERVSALHPANVDQTVTVFAKFAGSDEWEKVGTKAFDKGNRCTYEFTADQISREPYRVKVEYQAVSANTKCYISVKVRLKGDSEKVKQIAAASDTLHLENLGGVGGQLCWKGNVLDNTWFQDTSIENGNYSEPGIEDFTRRNYESILMRECANKYLRPVSKSAYSDKRAVVENDPDHSRTLVEYTLTAFEGYLAHDEETAKDLRTIGITVPLRSEVVFYDLLPYGIKYDSSIQPTAGRLTYADTVNKEYRSSAAQVTVDHVDVTHNWRKTGRTMVAFHVRYDGKRSSMFFTGHDASGYQLRFTGYYDWADKDVINPSATSENRNIAAYMTENGDELLGTETEISKDDGKEVDGTTPLTAPYVNFRSGDLNENGVTDKRSVLYMNTSSVEDFTISATDKIVKKVRANANTSSAYGTTAHVKKDAGYTYDINVMTVNGLKNLVVFDRIENPFSEYDPNDTISRGWGDKKHWSGTLESVNTAGLRALGIAPVVYYNKNADVDLGKANQRVDADTPDTILTRANGWIRADEYDGDLADVKAVAVDMRKKTDGTDFELGAGKSVSFEIGMKAPDDVGDEIQWSYNNSSYISTAVKSGVTARVISNTTRVTLGTPAAFVVEKEFASAEDVPDAMKYASFLFTATLDGEAFGNRYFTVQTKEDGAWVDEATRVTNYDGTFELRAGQRAVFTDLTTSERDALRVFEDRSPYWSAGYTVVTDPSVDGGLMKELMVTNTYRPILYVQKKIQGVESTNRTFTFRITQDGKPVANRTFCYVKRARTDGSQPTIDTSKGDDGEGKTDSDGCVRLRQGDVIALYADRVGEEYTVTELDPTEDFLCEENSVTKTTEPLGTVAEITNYYRWKDIHLRKTILGQISDDADEHPFTFQVFDENGDPVTTKNAWAVLNPDGTLSEKDGEHGTLDGEGKFTAPVGNRTVVIRHFAGGKTFTIRELLEGENAELYLAKTGGIETFTLPVISGTKNVTITNVYRKIPLQITKRVVSPDPEKMAAAKNHEFSFTILVNGEPLADHPYILYDSTGKQSGTGTTSALGEVRLKAGESLLIRDAMLGGSTYEVKETEDPDYPQITPAANGSVQGTARDGETARADFVNGTSGVLLLKKNVVNDVVSHSFGPYAFAVQFSTDGGQTWEYDHALTGVKRYNGHVFHDAGTVDSENLSVNDGETLLIPVEDGTMYRVTEKEPNQIRSWNGKWYHISQSSPDASSIEASVDEQPFAEFTNTVEEIPEKSVIYKRVNGLTQPKNGDVIRFRLEVYTGVGWVPAEGIPYYTRALSSSATGAFTASGLEKTGADGIIPVTVLGENEIPQLVFTEDIVKIDPTGPKRGTLRIREVAASSDFGELIGYADHATGAEKTHDANEFVNSTTKNRIRIDKLLTDSTASTGEDFVFTIAGVLAQDVTLEGTVDIRKESPLDGVEYRVFSRETGELVRTGTTTADGQFTLKAGEYAEFPATGGMYYHVWETDQPDSSFSFDKTEGTNYRPLDHGALIYADPANNEDAADGPVLTLHYMDGTGKVTREKITASTKLPQALTADDPTIGFDGEWYLDEACTKKYEGTIASETKDVELYAKWRQATFKPGQEMNVIMKELAGASSPTTNTDDRTITAFKRASSLPADSVRTVNVATADSTPVTMWFDNGTIWYFSKASEVFLNEDSSGMFYKFRTLSDIESLRNVRADRVRDMSAMFIFCQKIPSLKPLSGWNTSKVEKLVNTFTYCEALTNVDGLENWDTGNVVDISALFDGLTHCNDLEGVRNWDTSKVRDMLFLFVNCYVLTSDSLEAVSGWDTSSLENFQESMVRCYALTNANAFRNWNTDHVYDIAGMFLDATSLTDISGLANWNVSKCEDLEYTFYGCRITDTTPIRNWDTSSCTNMERMFCECSKLETLDIRGWNMDKVTNKYLMLNYVGQNSEKPVRIICTQAVRDKIAAGASLGSHVEWEIIG